MADALGWRYTPAGETTRAFLKSDAFVRGLRGPIGSGKSTACVMDILRRAAMQRPGPDGVRRSRWAVIRNTYPELKTTTIQTWHQWVPPSVGKWTDSATPKEHLLRFEDVELQVWFVALDRPQDVAKLLSMELTGAWINEAREVPKAILDGLTGRVGRYPAVKDGGASWFGIILDTNPPDTDHWWYKLAEERQPEGFAFFGQPAGDGPAAENLANLPAGYYERAKAGKDAEWIKVYVHGDYGFVQDGKPVYPEWRDGMHCRPAPLDPRRELWVGIDFGLTPAAAFGQRDVLGRWRVIDELVCEDMGALRFTEMLGQRMRERYEGVPVGGIFGDPSGDNRAQTDETTPFQILRAGNIMARPAPSNDFVLRREAVAKPLGRLIDGEPGLVVDPGCRMIRKGMGGGYAYRRIQVSGQERFRDVPDKNAFSHPCEALQYLMLGAGEGKSLIRSEASKGAPLMQHTNYDPLGYGLSEPRAGALSDYDPLAL